jgi:hypothetical protein
MSDPTFDPRHESSRLAMKSGFFTGIGLALCAPVVVGIAKLFDAIFSMLGTK